MRMIGLMFMMSLLTTHVVNAGGGEMYEQRQQALNSAYVQQTPVQVMQVMQEKQGIQVDIKEPDIGDRVYVWLRTFVSGWIIMGTFLFGAVTLGVHKFRKDIKKWLKGVLTD